MMEKIPAPTPREELTFLIIDNQGLVHDVVTATLKAMGIAKVSSALNAFHALRLCEQTRFDFVLIAFNVSNDKDGFHLFEELKHLNHIDDRTTVVFLSAETSSALVNCIVELQPDDFWVKPLDKKRIQQRLTYLISVRSKLNKVLHCMAERDFSAAIYHAERQLKDPAVSDYHPRMKRLIGECLLQLRDYPSAETYYRALLDEVDYAWCHIGLARALLRQDKLEEAQTLVEDMLVRPDTKFLTYDLLAQYFIEKEQFTQAYEQVKQASKLAPRNIERNKKLWDLARLNHDKHGQLDAVQNMAKFAKNSIHDSPELQLNVIRSTIDLATSKSDTAAEILLRRAHVELDELKQRKGMEKQLGDQFKVIEARLLCLQNEKKAAENLMRQKARVVDGHSMEDNLDKMKAFHELGMREQCLNILDKLRQQIEGDTFSSQVVDEYLKQESIERKEIHFTTKELKQMAAVNYKENRLAPAYNNLRQALTLSPQDTQLALSLLKVLVQINKANTLTGEQLTTARQTAAQLSAASIAPTHQQKRDQYIKALGLSLDADNDSQAGEGLLSSAE